MDHEELRLLHNVTEKFVPQLESLSIPVVANRQVLHEVAKKGRHLKQLDLFWSTELTDQDFIETLLCTDRLYFCASFVIKGRPEMT